MDAEYNQWQMYGEAVANAGPYYMQHGNWRVEIEPSGQQKEDVFLHVMIPCDSATTGESRRTLKNKVKTIRKGDVIELELRGKSRVYRIQFNAKSQDARIIVAENQKLLLDKDLGQSAKLKRVR